jgi:hypothetical protein
LLHPRLALRDQYFLYRLLAVTDTNEGDYASVSVLVGTNPHKLQVTVIDERLQRVATHVDCRQSHFAAIGQFHPLRTTVSLPAADGLQDSCL